MPSQESSSWSTSTTNSSQFKPKISCSKESTKAATPKSGLSFPGLAASVSVVPRFSGPFDKSLPLNTATATSKGPKGPSIRERIADFREKVRVEDLALSGHDDHVKLKDTVGGWAFTPEQMRHLKVTPYEYNASAGSYLELLVMQRFWTWLATFIPSHIAPCSITALGFLINLLTCSILISYSPDAKSEVPRWTLALAALGVFLYQIMDALDGKQCYKVQNTQIEEFYDHGCDAVSTILLMYATAIATQCGHYPALTLAVLFGSLIAFYSTHWQCYVTDQMVFGKIDVTEAQWSMILIHLGSALLGQSIWLHTTIPLFPGFELTLTQILSIMSLTSLANAILSNAAIVILGVQTPLDKAGVSIPRRAGNRLKPVVPISVLTILAFICYSIGYYHLNSTMYILMFGFTYAKLTMKLVIAHCTKSELDLSDPALAAPILMALNHFSSAGPLIAPNKALLCALIANTIELIRYFTCVSWDLRVALEVYIFSIRYPPGHPKSRRSCGGFYVNGLNNQEVLKRVDPK